jgi:hypothetical protein
MLNKEICKKCYEKQKLTGAKDFWHNGIIYCYGKSDELNFCERNSIYERPSKNCPYKLEHLLKEND